MTEPTRGQARLPALALAFAISFVLSWAATALLLAGGFVFIEGSPDLSAGLGRALLFPVFEAFVLFVLAAIVGAVTARGGTRREGLLGGLLGVLVGGILASLAIVRLAGEEETGGISTGLFLTGIGLLAYLGGFMIGHSIASASSSVPSRWPSSNADGPGPRWPSP